MIEVVIALFITVVAVMAVFALVAPGWNTSAKSDYLGRASGILYEQLVRQEARIMNPCCQVLPVTLNASVTLGPTTVNASGQATLQSGDVPFNVTTTITNLGAAIWRVTVTVTWTGNANGISESMVVTRQDGFATTQGCVTGGTVCQ